jgi:hypothetical protein
MQSQKLEVGYFNFSGLSEECFGCKLILELGPLIKIIRLKESKDMQS